MLFLVVALLAYLLGSIPFGLLVTSFGGAGDIRKIGSGNIGATNVLRTGRKGLAAATLLLDVGKGVAAVILARIAGPHLGLAADGVEQLALLAGACCFVGHIFPVWLGFKGGKGVATALGVLLAMSWPVAVIVLLVWLLVAFTLRYSSLSALIAAAISPLAAWALVGGRLALLALFIAILVFIRHRANIERLLAGTESKIGLKRQS